MSIDNLIRTLIKEEIDLLKGKSKNMSVLDIAKKHDVPVSQIQKQINKGIDIEFEHTKNKRLARKIAMDHLVEFPDYYDRLIKMEKEAAKKWEK